MRELVTGMAGYALSRIMTLAVNVPGPQFGCCRKEKEYAVDDMLLNNALNSNAPEAL
jgi:hypothetical protein